MTPNFENREAIPMEGEVLGMWTRLGELGFDAAQQTLVDNAILALSGLEAAFSRNVDMHTSRTQSAINNMDVYRRRVRADLLRILDDDDGSRLAGLILQKGQLPKAPGT